MSSSKLKDSIKFWTIVISILGMLLFSMSACTSTQHCQAYDDGHYTIRYPKY